MDIPRVTRARLRAFLKDTGMLVVKIPAEEMSNHGYPLATFIEQALDEGIDYLLDDVLLTGTQLRLCNMDLTIWCKTLSPGNRIILSVGGREALTKFPQTVRLIEELIREYEFNDR